MQVPVVAVGKAVTMRASGFFSLFFFFFESGLCAAAAAVAAAAEDVVFCKLLVSYRPFARCGADANVGGTLPGAFNSQKGRVGGEMPPPKGRSINGDGAGGFNLFRRPWEARSALRSAATEGAC
jgi:hypothetical protein